MILSSILFQGNLHLKEVCSEARVFAALKIIQFISHFELKRFSVAILFVYVFRSILYML